MKISEAITPFILGVVISLGAQFAGLWITGLFPIGIQLLDPALKIIYSSIGLTVSILFAIFFFCKKKQSVVIGIVLGVLLWWPFLIVWMGITGTWL